MERWTIIFLCRAPSRSLEFFGRGAAQSGTSRSENDDRRRLRGGAIEAAEFEIEQLRLRELSFRSS